MTRDRPIIICRKINLTIYNYKSSRYDFIVLYYILLIYLRVSSSIKKKFRLADITKVPNNKITTECFFFFTEQSNIIYFTYILIMLRIIFYR